MTAGSGPTRSVKAGEHLGKRHISCLQRGEGDSRHKALPVFLGPPGGALQLAMAHAASCLHEGTVGAGRTEGGSGPKKMFCGLGEARGQESDCSRSALHDTTCFFLHK